jgi:hypothetical protein
VSDDDSKRMTALETALEALDVAALETALEALDLLGEAVADLRARVAALEKAIIPLALEAKGD